MSYKFVYCAIDDKKYIGIMSTDSIKTHVNFSENGIYYDYCS